MKASLKNFMTGLIDYAGLFPPASLDIQTVLDNYTAYLESEDGWILGRCILPASQLYRVTFHPGFRCSVIVSPAVSEEEFDQLVKFCAMKGRVEMVETRFPEDINSLEHFSEHFQQLHSRLRQTGLQDVQLFVETKNVADAAAAIASFNNSRSGGDVIRDVGYKLRCGGMEKQVFPPPEKVAGAISICREHDIPIKFTAGMHLPFRNYSVDIKVMQHGFVNVFGAALLCWGCNLSTKEITECLRDENAGHFHFMNESFSWKNKMIPVSEIKRLRQSRVISFGCCSFTEPVEGLRSPNLLDSTGA